MKLYSFRFSPPARLARLAAEICEVDYKLIEVDLSKAEQFSPEFLAVNPKHQVPALEDGGEYMAQSRDICRYLFDNYKKSSDNDHWYPEDPAKREEVNEWLDWSKPIHIALETSLVMAHIGPQAGVPFRDNYGLLICLLGVKARMDTKCQEDLRKYMDIAEEMVGKRNIKTVDDLNIGDLATFMEISMPLECHSDYKWSQYPNLKHLYTICKLIPSFNKVHQPFLVFAENYRFHRDRGTTASWFEIAVQVKYLHTDQAPIWLTRK